MIDDRVVVAATDATPEQRAAIFERARGRGFRHFLVDSTHTGTAGAGPKPFTRSSEGLSEPDALPGALPVPVHVVQDPEGLRRALETAPARGVVALRWRGDRVIPLETAVAQRKGRFRLWVVTDRAADAPAALGALEAGADRLFVELRRVEEVDDLEATMEAHPPLALNWTGATIERVMPGGLGDRVVVDLTSVLRPEEGMLVGSAAGYLFHIASEAEGSAFTRPRRFRVNAGAAHSYALLADGTTRYLDELEPGDAVLVTAPRSTARTARVGRLKIERRPLVLVRAMALGHARTVFLQEAETVRLSTAERRVAVTDLRPGALVEGVSLPPARHLGTAVHETIEER